MSDVHGRFTTALANRSSIARHMVVSGRAEVFLRDSGIKRCGLLLIIGSLLLPLGCGGNDDIDGPPTVLQPSELCSDHPDYAIATFEDTNLEAATRTALSVGEQEPLTCGLISGLTVLDASDAGITSLVGIQNLTSLMHLRLWGNSISDINALSGLTNLSFLDLSHNSISDIGALSGLTSLETIYLNDNSISDISALSGLTSPEAIYLANNSISDIGALSGLTSLTHLTLSQNSISDIGALSGLTNLIFLTLSHNSISDIGALSGLTRLVTLHLDNNPDLTDIQPLLDNTGLGGAHDTVYLQSTSVSCSDVAALEAKGVTVFSDCP